MYKLIAATVVIALLSGCAKLRSTEMWRDLTAGDEQSAGLDCGDLLAYNDELAQMNDEQRKQERKTLAQQLAQTPGSCYQLRHALLLSQPDYPAKQRNEALQQLSALLADSNNLRQRDIQLAQLLHGQLRLQQKQQSRVHQLRHQLRQENATSLTLSIQLTELQSQLEQLKNIERNINEKEQAIITPATDNIPHEPTPGSAGR